MLELEFFTSGQVASKLRISVSTLKRWIDSNNIISKPLRNNVGWRIFSLPDLEALKKFKISKNKRGQRYSLKTLKPMEKI